MADFDEGSEEDYGVFSSVVEPRNDESQTKWQLDCKDIIEDIERNLRGEVWDEESGKWIKKHEALMNDEGISTIMNIVKSVLTKNTILSNLTQEEINVIMKDLMVNLVQIIGLEYASFQVKRSNFDLILNVIEDPVYFTLKRAYLEGERELLKATSKRIEQIQYKGLNKGNSTSSFLGNVFKKDGGGN